MVNDNDSKSFIRSLNSTIMDESTHAIFILPMHQLFLVTITSGTLLVIGFATTHTLSFSTFTSLINRLILSYSTPGCPSFLTKTSIKSFCLMLHLPRGLGILYLWSRYLLSTMFPVSINIPHSPSTK